MKTVQAMAPAGAHLSVDPTGQGSCVQNKWQLLRVIEQTREALGLKGTSIALLRAMLSFLRSDNVNTTCDANHICFASNAALAQRAHVSVQTVERHVAKLVSLGLVTRKVSGNGKRWARRDASGNITIATGLSLMPIVHRYAEFSAIAQMQEKQRLKSAELKDRCAIGLAELKKLAAESTAYERLKSNSQRLFRRKLDPVALNNFLEEITAELSAFGGKNPSEMRGTDTQDEGHKETYPTQLVEKKKKPDEIRVNSAQMHRAFPRLCNELRFAHSQDACERQMDELASHLHLGAVWITAKEQGNAAKFMLLGYLLERIDTIKAPRAYARRLMADIGAGALGWDALLKPAKRSQLTLVNATYTRI